jgi:hypothetical protein
MKVEMKNKELIPVEMMKIEEAKIETQKSRS